LFALDAAQHAPRALLRAHLLLPLLFREHRRIDRWRKGFDDPDFAVQMMAKANRVGVQARFAAAVDRRLSERPKPGG